MGPAAYTSSPFLLTPYLPALPDGFSIVLVLCRYRAYLHQILAAMKAPYLQIQELANNVVRVCHAWF
jgi:hypothetical protein